MRRLLFLSLLALAACNGGGGGDSTTEAGSGLFGRVTANGAGVANAAVFIGAQRTQTDADGRFTLAAPPGPAVVTIQAPAHVINVQRVTLIDGPNALSVALLPEAPAVMLDATQGGEAMGARGARVVVPAGALVSPVGASVGGEVAVHVTPIDPSIPAELDAAPGDFEARTAGGAPAQLESFGMLDVTIRQGDEVLDVAEGQTLQISIPAPSGVTDPPASMPLWSFDEAQGLWIEEGTLTLDADAGVYVGEIAHMSAWNADRPLDTTCISGRVVDSDGNPVPGARVRGRGVDYTGSDATVADADGRFALLVRKDSLVSVAAYHADGGGQVREVRSGSATAPQPVNVGDASCTDGGTWTVERGTVVFDDGRRVVCTDDAFARLGLQQCLPFMAEVTDCYRPEGACTQEGIFTTRYANGAASVAEINDGEVSITLIGASGVECATQTVSGSSVTIILPDGRSETYGVDFNADTGAVTYTCTDGSQRTITAEDQEILAACTGNSEQECAQSGGGGNIGEACEASAECGAGNRCCLGICITEELCPVAAPCESDAECTDGALCCPATNSCQTEDDCVALGGCTEDAQCGEGSACCDGDCVGRPYCEGTCRVDDECAEGICCLAANDDLNYCAADATDCYRGRECVLDTDCGDPATLTCCDGTCDTWDGCYEGEVCVDDGGCGGAGSPLECCEREDGLSCETPSNCASFRPCDDATPCGADTICCADSFITDQPICLTPTFCALNKPCETSEECAGGQCCAVPGQDAICAEDCPEEWRQ